MLKWLVRDGTGSSQHVVSSAEFERVKKEKSNLLLNRKLTGAMNDATGEDLFKQENGAGRPRFIVKAALQFRKSLFMELTGPPLHEMYGSEGEDAFIRERVGTWVQKVKGGPAAKYHNPIPCYP